MCGQEIGSRSLRGIPFGMCTVPSWTRSFYSYQSILSFLDQVRWASPPCCAPDREQSGKVPLPGIRNAERPATVSGQKYGRGPRKEGGDESYWPCVCACGRHRTKRRREIVRLAWAGAARAPSHRAVDARAQPYWLARPVRPLSAPEPASFRTPDDPPKGNTAAPTDTSKG